MSTTRKRLGIKPDEDAAGVVRLIADLYLRGMSLLKICRHLESNAILAPKGGRVWHPVIVQKVLTNPLHAGLIHNNDEYIEGAHYACRIYDPEVFHHILDVMESRKKFGPQTLACVRASLGLVAVCDECGDRLRIIRPDDPYRSYRCEGPRLKGLVCNSRPYVKGEHLERVVVREIEKVATDPMLLANAEEESRTMLSAAPSGHAAEMTRLTTERAELARKWLRLADDHANGRISQDMLAVCDVDYGARRAAIDARMVELDGIENRSASQEEELSRVMRALRDFPTLWQAMEPEEKRTVFTLLIESLRVGRGDGCIRVKLKLRFVDEIIIDLPVHSIWSSARNEVEKPRISYRQLAYLALAADGYSDRQIAARWRVKITNVKVMRTRSIAKMGATTLDEAVELARPRLVEWREFLPLDGRHGSPGTDVLSLSDEEMQVVRGIAAGKTDRIMAEECAVPLSTISGRRNRLRQKLNADSKEALVGRALSLGVLGPSDPSPDLLLRAYRRLLSPIFRDRLETLGVSTPTDRQMECLRALVDGLTAQQTAEQMRVGLQSIVFLRQRLWRIVRADSLRTALDQVRELGILQWPDEPSEVDR